MKESKEKDTHSEKYHREKKWSVTVFRGISPHKAMRPRVQQWWWFSLAKTKVQRRSLNRATSVQGYWTHSVDTSFQEQLKVLLKCLMKCKCFWWGERIIQMSGAFWRCFIRSIKFHVEYTLYFVLYTWSYNFYFIVIPKQKAWQFYSFLLYSHIHSVDGFHIDRT